MASAFSLFSPQAYPHVTLDFGLSYAAVPLKAHPNDHNSKIPAKIFLSLMLSINVVDIHLLSQLYHVVKVSFARTKDFCGT